MHGNSLIIGSVAGKFQVEIEIMFKNREKWRRLIRTASLALCLPFLFVVSSVAEEDIQALSTRLSQPTNINRIEIVLTQPIGFRVFTLDNPRRVVVDMPDIHWKVQPPRAGASMRFVDAVRFGMYKADASRMVIDLRRAARVEAATVKSENGNHIFTIDLGEESAANFASRAGWPDVAGETDDDETAVLSGPIPKKRPSQGIVVAIDPGHGGIDPGATYCKIFEKQLVLQYALKLAENLEAIPGFTPYLTRTEDTFLSLRERVALARQANADVLVSIHADALEKGVASGASVFTLSDEASGEEAADLVQSHNRADVIAGVRFDETPDDVAKVLVDLARRNTDVSSRQLATVMVHQLEAHAEILKGRSLQSAGFRVLKAPDVPSVLVEVGFLSSEKDRLRLVSEAGQKAVLRAISEAIVQWAAGQSGKKFDFVRGLR